MQRSKHVTPHFLHQVLAIHNENNTIENEFQPLLVGIGGSGSNMVSKLSKKVFATTLATNTDARHLRSVRTDKKLLMGLDITNGEGTGNRPKVGQSAAVNQQNQIKKIYTDFDTVFLITGLGGGTGTGAVPIFAELAKRQEMFTIAICTFPFQMEGDRRQEHAFKGLDLLEEICDIVVLIPNDNLEGLSDIPVNQAFGKVDEIIAKLVEILIRAMKMGVEETDIIYEELSTLDYMGLEHLTWEYEKSQYSTKFYLLSSEGP